MICVVLLEIENKTFGTRNRGFKVTLIKRVTQKCLSREKMFKAFTSALLVSEGVPGGCFSLDEQVLCGLKFLGSGVL